MHACLDAWDTMAMVWFQTVARWLDGRLLAVGRSAVGCRLLDRRLLDGRLYDESCM